MQIGTIYSAVKAGKEIWTGKLAKITPYPNRGNLLRLEDDRGNYQTFWESDKAVTFVDPKSAPQRPVMSKEEQAAEVIGYYSTYRGA